jgi:hypothetical protein
MSKNQSNKYLKVVKYFLVIILLISVFKNISYPLFWADESMTAMGAERVLQFGFPKISDGKNVIYDLRHPNKRLGANEKNDAYVGGAGWLQYYYGTIGYSIANQFDDVYVKTGVFRSSFAIIGLVGLFILLYFFSKFIKEPISKEIIQITFLILTISSISLVLLIREVRYFPLVFLMLYAILSCYFIFRFYNRFNEKIFVSIIVILHPLCIITFSPIYFIILATLGIIEGLIFISNVVKKNVKSAFQESKPIIIAAVLSILFALPLLSYFKVFEINQAMSEFNGYSSEMYWNNLKTGFNYFLKFEFLMLAVVVKILLLPFIYKLWNNHKSIIQVSLSLSLFFIIFLFAISRMHGVLYTRYIIYLQPILSFIILYDLYLLFGLINSSNLKFKSLITSSFFAISFLAISLKIYQNKGFIEGHIYEMTNQYKGPLDETIPYIKENFPNHKDLIISTNYEETSYMYYLKSKVIIGYVENNLKEDLKYKPDIISFRPNWGDRSGIFARYISKNEYFVKRFDLKNTPTNMISEFNYLPKFTHKFKTESPNEYKESVQLWIHTKYGNQ